jgi:hypothetical protein
MGNSGFLSESKQRLPAGAMGYFMKPNPAKHQIPILDLILQIQSKGRV